MVVKLNANQAKYPDVSVGQEYAVIGIEADDYRILNDAGKPYLYPHEDFEVVDGDEPVDWVVSVGDDGERYAYPPALNTVGFFEDFFDAKREAIAAFWRVVNQKLLPV